MEFYENIKKYRKKAGLTQIQLAEKLGVGIATLRRWEEGYSTPNGAKILSIAKILNVSPTVLFTTGEKEKNNNGMLVFERGNLHIELPPDEKGYELLRQLIKESDVENA